jgi:hypothetical protein
MEVSLILMGMVAAVLCTTALLAFAIVEAASSLVRLVLPVLTDAADDAIKAYRYAWELRAGLHRPESVSEPISEDRQDLEDWLTQNSNGEDNDGHIVGMWEAVNGDRPSTQDKLADYRNTLLNLGVPLPGTPKMTMGG